MKKRGVPRLKLMNSYASPLKRVLALVIDLVVLSIVVLGPFNRVLNSLIPVEGGFSNALVFLQQNRDISSVINIVSISIVILALLYFILLDYLVGQTIGKKILGLYVESLNGKIKLWQCVVRNIELIPFFPFVILWIIDPIYMFWKGQRLMEILSKTKTVQKSLAWRI